MGITRSYLRNDGLVDNHIEVLPNTSLMCLIYCDIYVKFFTEELKFVDQYPIFLSNINNMEKISHCLGFEHVVDISKLYPNDNFDFSQYKLINMWCEPMHNKRTWCFTGHIAFIIKIPTLNSMKHNKTYRATFHKYKIICNMVCLDVVNFIFRLIMNIEIDHYYLAGLIDTKLKLDDEFKHKFICAIRNVSHLNI